MWNYIIFSTFVVVISLLCHHNFNKALSFVQRPRDRYDYIVVGAGTAGCVIASRLSEDPNVTVLLVEAGGYFNWMSTIPFVAPLIQASYADWSYKTEQQFYSSRGLIDARQSWPRGKGLGGSGQMNFLVHSFGRPEDYVEWPWSFVSLQPYFQKVANIMKVKTLQSEYELMKAFHASDKALDDENVHFWKPAMTLNDGARWSTYNAYLKQAWNRGNLHILIKTLVTKVVLDSSNKIEGVEVQYEDGSSGVIEAKKDVVLCAGTINTPQLLLISGIGPSEELESHDIPIKQNLPAVGKNLFDHLNLPIYVNLKSPVSITLKKLLSFVTFIEYFVYGVGLLAFNGIMGFARFNNSAVFMSGVASSDEKLLREIANFKSEVFRALFPAHQDTGREGFLLMGTCWQPKSRGNITLTSKDILDPPKIDPAYLEHDDDVSCMQHAIKLALRILEKPLFHRFGASVHVPNFKECRHFQRDYSDDEFSECVLRIAAITSYHPGGTCKMGLENDTVVDENLRVRGIEGLRIMDASVLPSPISGMPNSLIIAMAERAVDLFKQKNQQRSRLL